MACWRDARNGRLLWSSACAEAISQRRAPLYEMCLNYLRPLFRRMKLFLVLLLLVCGVASVEAQPCAADPATWPQSVTVTRDSSGSVTLELGVPVSTGFASSTPQVTAGLVVYRAFGSSVSCFTIPIQPRTLILSLGPIPSGSYVLRFEHQDEFLGPVVGVVERPFVVTGPSPPPAPIPAVTSGGVAALVLLTLAAALQRLRER